jgi:hypothetical protein
MLTTQIIISKFKDIAEYFKHESKMSILYLLSMLKKSFIQNER